MPEQKPQVQYFLGLDLGQVQDPTALAVVERTVRPDPDDPRQRPLNWYAVRALKRWPLGTPYPRIVDDCQIIVKRKPLDHPLLAVDQTGVGRAVVDSLREVDLGAVLRPIVITSGHVVTMGEDGAWRVPKKDLVGTLQVLLQERRFKISPMPEKAILDQELLNFKVKITLHANETYEAWREKEHDDAVLAIACATWLAERCGGPGEGAFRTTTDRPRPHWMTRQSRAEQKGLFGMRPNDRRNRK